MGFHVIVLSSDVTSDIVNFAVTTILCIVALVTQGIMHKTTIDQSNEITAVIICFIICWGILLHLHMKRLPKSSTKEKPAPPQVPVQTPGLHQFLMSLPGGALIVDKGKIIFANGIAKELLGNSNTKENMQSKRYFSEYLTLREKAEILHEYTL